MAGFLGSAAKGAALEFVKRRSVEELREYVQQGGDLFYRNRYGQNLVFEAVQRQDRSRARAEDILKFLIDEGNLPYDATDAQLKQTPLFFAVARGAAGCVSLLLERGALVQRPDKILQTPLYYAAREGHSACLQLLLQAKSEVTSRDVNAQLPHFYATHHGHCECARLLLSHADQTQQVARAIDRRGRTALFDTVDLECCRLLLEGGCEPSAVDAYGQSALFSACRDGLLDKVSLLIEYNANVNRTDKHRQAALFYAAAEGHLDVCQTLVERNADLSLQDTYAHTAAQVAQHSGHSTLRFQLDLWAREQAGGQPLSLASSTAVPAPLACGVAEVAAGPQQRQQQQEVGGGGGMDQLEQPPRVVAAPPVRRVRLRTKAPDPESLATTSGGGGGPGRQGEKRKFIIAFADPKDPTGASNIPFGTAAYERALWQLCDTCPLLSRQLWPARAPLTAGSV